MSNKDPLEMVFDRSKESDKTDRIFIIAAAAAFTVIILVIIIGATVKGIYTANCENEVEQVEQSE